MQRSLVVVLKDLRKINFDKNDSPDVKAKKSLRYDNLLAQRQHLAHRLVTSRNAAIIAVHRVLHNVGARSAGWSPKRKPPTTNQEYQFLIDKVQEIAKNPKIYSATPLYRIYIPKAVPGKFRPISVPSYLDRCLQALYHLALDPYAEFVAAKDSYGFRKGRSPIWAALRTQNLLNNPTISIPYAIELDIEGCFDNIDHGYIIENIPLVPKSILVSWLKCGYITPSEPDTFQETPKGVPQGSIISPTISNIVLDGIDPNAFSENPSLKKPSRYGAKTYYIRFADDVLILVPPGVDPKSTLDGIKSRLSKRGLKVSEAKTKITALHLKKGSAKFDFVGFEFLVFAAPNKSPGMKGNKMNQKCLFRPKKSNLKRHKESILTSFKTHFSLTHIIFKTNPVITGFCNYYRFSNASATFGNLSRWQYHAMCNFLHKRKGWSVRKINAHLAKEKNNPNCPASGGWFHYFGRWKGRRQDNRVIFWKRYVKNFPIIYPFPRPQPGYNYYDLIDRSKIINVNLGMSVGKKKAVLLRAKGTCACCDSNLIDVTFEIHHVHPIQFGGSDEVKNLIPLCRYPCHTDISRAVKGLPKTRELVLEYIEKGLLSNIPEDLLKEDSIKIN